MLYEVITIDINTHIIVQTGNAAPGDYYESFIKAGTLGIISIDLSEKLAPSAGLRNRLVHEYDLLDSSLILDDVRMVGNVITSYSIHYTKLYEFSLCQIGDIDKGFGSLWRRN